MNKYCAICLWLAVTIIGAFALLFGFLGFIAVGIMGAIPGSGLPPAFPLAVGGLLFLAGIYMLQSTLKTDSDMRKVIGVTSSFERISIDDISRQSGVKLPKVRPLLFEAISKGKIDGTVRENMFIREKRKAGETVTIEREVMVTRKAPNTCIKCGASLNPQSVEWVGPDQIRCSHCGTTMSIETERM